MSVSPVTVLYNQGNTQVNSTGVYWAMALGINTTGKCAWTKLCYGYHPIANEELGQGETATNGESTLIRRHKAEMKRREAQHSH